MKTWFAFRCWSDTPWGHRNQGVLRGAIVPPPQFLAERKAKPSSSKDLGLLFVPPDFPSKDLELQLHTWPPQIFTPFYGPAPLKLSKTITVENFHTFFLRFLSKLRKAYKIWMMYMRFTHTRSELYDTWKKFAFSSFNFLFLSTDSFWQIMGICYHCLLSSETMSHLCPRRLIHRVDDLHISNS